MGPPPSAPQSFGGLPPLESPEGMDEPDFGLPPMGPPGQRRNVMGGLMK
jgi:hypothetical protein